MAVALLVPILCALAPARAPADEPQPGAWLKRWIAEEPMAGNWFGGRDVLQGCGVNPTISYATDLQASVSGGLRRGEAYAGQLTVEIDANMEKLVGLTGLRFDVSGAWSSGTDLSLDIGNTFTVAQYFEGRQVRLANMYFEQSLFDGRLSLKTGRFSTGAESLTSPIDFSFVNEALNPILLAVRVNVPGVTADPNVTWGGRVAVRPTPVLSLSAGSHSQPAHRQWHGVRHHQCRGLLRGRRDRLINPGGVSSVGNAVVLGAQVGIEF